MKPEDIVKALGLVTELALGIVEVTNALQSGMTPEELDAFIERQNELQEKLRTEILKNTEE